MLEIINSGICPGDHRIECRYFPACRNNCTLLNEAQYKMYVVEYVEALKNKIYDLERRIDKTKGGE